MKAKNYLYRNLHTKTFSLKHKGVVIEHPKTIIMSFVDFKVSQTGRNKVLKEKRKNVHAQLAFSKYIIINDEFNIKLIQHYLDNNELEEIYYNPYQNSSFIIKNSGKPIFSEDIVIGFDNKIYRFIYS